MDLVAELNGIGFTDSEAKVYLVLLRNNPATGYVRRAALDGL